MSTPAPEEALDLSAPARSVFTVRYTEHGETRVFEFDSAQLWDVIARVDRKFGCGANSPADALRFQRALALARGKASA